MNKKCPVCGELGIGLTFFLRISKGSFCVKCARCGALIKPYINGKFKKFIALVLGMLFGITMGMWVAHLAFIYPIVPKSIFGAEKISLVIYLYAAILMIFNGFVFVLNDFKLANKS